MQISLKASQKGLWMAGTSSRLVFVQHDGPVCISAGAVQPHVALALRRLAQLVKHLQGGFICVKHILLQQFLVKQVIDRSQQVLRGSQQPIGHGLL